MAGDAPTVDQNRPPLRLLDSPIVAQKATPAKTTAGQPANNTRPQPAVADPISTAEDSAKQAKEAGESAETALGELEDAALVLSDSYSKAATRDISDRYSEDTPFVRSADAERFKLAADRAEHAATQNILIKSKIQEDLRLAKVQAEDELKKSATSAGGIHRAQLLAIKLHNQWELSGEAVGNAEALQAAVREKIGKLPEDCVTQKYPGLAGADGAVQLAKKALRDFENSSKGADQATEVRREALRADVKHAVLSARAAWRAACDDVDKAGDKILETGCDSAVARLEGILSQLAVGN
jgi:hypothetical protein